MKKVVIVGLGYVGLPLALLAAKKGYNVIGLDNNEERVSILNDKKSPIDDKNLIEAVRNTKAKFTTDVSTIKNADIAIICVPTPVTDEKLPDLTPLRTAVESVASHIQPDKLVIIESTINPGVCNDIVIPIIEESGKFTVSKNLHVAHCPERINPGDPHWGVENINRVVGADSTEGLKQAKDFYESIIDGEIKAMGSLKEAEAVKIVENSFRDINIAFVNELAKSFQKMGVNLENVIDGAATKPFAFMPHHPGAGVGGHCIPVDPYYLIEHAKGFGFEHEFLQLARNINESMPSYTIELLEDLLDKKSLNKINAKVVVLGQAYKADVDDARESPAIKILSELVSLGYDAKAYDKFIPSKSDFKNLGDALDYADAVLVATGHSEFKTLSPSDYANHKVRVVVDGRNLYKSLVLDFKKSSVAYAGIGVPSS